MRSIITVLIIFLFCMQGYGQSKKSASHQVTVQVVKISDLSMMKPDIIETEKYLIQTYPEKRNAIEMNNSVEDEAFKITIEIDRDENKAVKSIKSPKKSAIQKKTVVPKKNYIYTITEK